VRSPDASCRRRGTEKYDVFGTLDKGKASEVVDLLARRAGGKPKVEAIEGFDRRKASDPREHLARAGPARVALGAQRGSRKSVKEASYAAAASATAGYTVVPWIRVLATSRKALGRQVRRRTVNDQPLLGQPAGQRNVEALPQIADEPPYLALGPRPIRRAQPRPEAAVPGKVQKAGVEAVSTATIAVSLDDDGAHVVVHYSALTALV